MSKRDRPRDPAPTTPTPARDWQGEAETMRSILRTILERSRSKGLGCPTCLLDEGHDLACLLALFL